MVSSKIQKMCAWGAVICMAMYLSGFLLAGFLPVPSPDLTPEQVADMFRDNTTGIRVGSVLMLASAFFVMTIVGLISAFMKRIEGDMPTMTYIQLGAGTLGILFFYVPAVLFFIMAYRPERPPELTYLLYDFDWLAGVGGWPSFVFQQVAIALAIFSDKRAQPIFPRWLGYFQLWTALLYMGSILLPFFKTGPFAWSGLFGFYIPGVAYLLWGFVMASMLSKAIDRLELEAAPQRAAVSLQQSLQN